MQFKTYYNSKHKSSWGRESGEAPGHDTHTVTQCSSSKCFRAAAPSQARGAEASARRGSESVAVSTWPEKLCGVLQGLLNTLLKAFSARLM